MRRREQREHIFKLLFMTQFNSEQEMDGQFDLYFDGLEGITDKDRAYIKEKYDHVKEHMEDIDRQLNETSRGWKTKRMSRVDLSALRLAVYELEYDQDVPVGVAINEAVELAKRFGGETSGSFVNGILGKIAAVEEKKAVGEAAPEPEEKRPDEEAAPEAEEKRPDEEAAPEQGEEPEEKRPDEEAAPEPEEEKDPGEKALELGGGSREEPETEGGEGAPEA
ncbi:MAG: transcription antitermination factor NusB [Eubacteriales bacterium]|nr:transcription antitermination factor NusB [Eubacteriales bacterium]